MSRGKSEKIPKNKPAKKKSSDLVDVSVRVSPELKMAIKMEAKRQGVSQGAIARAAVENYLKSV